MKKKFAIVLALFLIAVVCSAGCIDPETPVDPVDPVVPVDPITPVDPVDPVVPVEEYSVMFMLNYGDAGAYTAETVKAGETVSKPATPTRSGYTFKGWFTAAEGGAEYDFTQAVNADVTLYAQWKKKSSSSSSSSSSSGSTNSNAHLQGTTVTPSIGNAVTGDGSSTSVTGTVEETSGNTVVTVTDPSGVKMAVTYGSGASTNGNTVTGTVSSVTVTYPEKDAGTASADSPDASSSLQLELTKAVGTLPTIDSDFKQDVSSKITTAFSGDKPLAMITASNTEQVNSEDTIKEDGLTITFKLTGLNDEDKSKLVGYHVSGADVETVTPESVTSTGDTTTVVLKGDSFSSWAVGIAKDCPHNDLKLTHDAGTTFDKATHSGNCGDCDSAVNKGCTFTATTQAGGSILHECSKCGYQYSKAGSEMNLDSVTIPEDGTITSAAQLFKLAQLVNAGKFTGAVTLGIDIDLAGVEWTPIGTTEHPFTGTFDGKGYTIKGLTNKEDATSFGLFEKVSGTVVIENFDLHVNAVDSKNVKSEGWAGVVGKSNGAKCDLTLENIKVYGTLTADDKVAGIIAQAPTYADNGSELTVRNCENYATVTGTRAAGICCSINTDSGNTFENCVNHGTITAKEGKYQTAAGILCKNEAETVFTECKNEGTLDASIAYNIATKLVITFDSNTYRAGAVRAKPADKYYYTMSNPDVESMYNLFEGEPCSAVDWEQVVRTSNSIDLTGLGAGVWYDTENAADYLVTVTTKKATPNGGEQKYYKTLKAFKTLDDALLHSLDGAEVTLKADQGMNVALTSGVIGATGIFKTLNLNDHTLTMNKNITVNGNGLTIKNGAITHNAVGELFVLTGEGVPGVVTFDNVTLDASGKCIAKIGASFAGALNYNEYSSISGYIDLTGNPATELTINGTQYFQAGGRYVVITNNFVAQKPSLTESS